MDSTQVAAAIALVTGLISALVSGWLALRRSRYEEQKETDVRAFDQMKAIVEHLREVDKQRDESFRQLQNEYDARMRQLRRERDQIMQELSWAVADLSSAEATLRIYEARLKEKGEDITPWKPREHSSHLMDAIDG